MTIKQHGGIFGRNPTFNNVTVDGTLTVDQIVEKTGAAGITLDGVTLKDGNVVLANGKGIDFSATAGTGTSELFDDYEEGTWTPEYKGSVSDPTIVYGTQSGSYTKIGRYVYFQLSLVVTTTSGGSGNLIISGLPFASAASTSALGGCVNTWTSIFAAWTTNAPQNGHIPAASTNILLNYSSATDTPQIGVANLANNSELNMQGFYQV